MDERGQRPRMRVEEWMTHDPLTAGADVKLQDALAQMVRHRVRHLPVLEAGQFFGLLSGPSLLRRLLVHQEVPLDQAARMPIREWTDKVDSLHAEDPVSEALAKLNEQVCLPVVEEGRLEGLFSHHNLLEYLQRQLRPDRVRRGGATPTTHRLDSLLSMVRAVSQSDDVQAILATAAQFLRNLMPIHQAYLLLRQGEREELSVAAAYISEPEGRGHESAETGGYQATTMPLQDTLSGYVYTHRRSLRVDDLNQEKRFPHSRDLWSDHTQLRSVIATPLLDQSKSVGVLSIWTERAYAYVDSDLELLELVSGYLSFMILRAWQLEKEKELVAQLQQANRIKDEFLAVVTHDLRNSIQGILALTQLLQRRTSDPAHRELTRAIQDSTKHMSSLTHDLHDLAKLGMEAIRLNLAPCSLAASIDLVAEELSQFARNHDVSLERCNIDENLEIEADPVRLRQIISNLISNAIKYNRKGGWVRLRAYREGERAILEVEDSGIGIAAEEQQSVFQLFQRANNSRSLDGSGLGLAITQQLAGLHGGSLELRSQLGVGSTFRVALPALAAIHSGHEGRRQETAQS